MCLTCDYTVRLFWIHPREINFIRPDLKHLEVNWWPWDVLFRRDFENIAITVEVASPLKILIWLVWLIWLFGVDDIDNYGNDGDYVNIGTMIFTMKSESDPAKHRR